MPPDRRRDVLAVVAAALIAGALAAALAVLSGHDFLLFHSVVELLAVVVGATVFSIGWNARRFVQDNLLMALSTGYLAVSAFEVLHALAYVGMGVFHTTDPNLATQFWIGARWIESATYLAGALLVGRRPIRAGFLLLGSCAAAVTVAVLIFAGAFPACYRPGLGLTDFKVFSELAVSLGFAVSAWLLWRQRRRFDRTVIALLLAALVVTILSEFAFMSYVSVTGDINALGHLLKLVSTGLLYAALVRWSLRQPYETLFKDLARSEENLKAELAVRRRAQAALLEAKDAAEAGSRAKSEFLANMSHEIRTPMNAVIGMTDLVLEGRLTAEQRELLGMARASAGALLEIINDVLDFSRIEAGKLELHATRFDLIAVIEEATQAMAVRAREKGLELVCAFHPDVPRDVIGDGGRIRQMVLNLVSNAVKFTDTGEVSVRVTRRSPGSVDGAGESATHSPARRATIAISVRDTGPGIPPDKRGLLFKSFSQVDGSITRRYGGTGLGLAICRHLAEQMGGSIDLDSREGAGSTFTLTIPLQIPEDLPTPALRVSTGAGMPRALVIDDNDASRAAIVEALCALGCEAEGVRGGDGALEVLRSAAPEGRPFDAVLIDVQMPGMDGYQTLDRIRHDDVLRDIGVLMMTSLTGHCDRSSCAHGAAARCLIKPIRRATLVDSLQSVLRSAPPAWQPAAHAGRSPLPMAAAQADVERPVGVKGHVLVAEDNRVNQKLVEVLLSRRGWQLTCVGNGLDAIRAVECFQFNAVLMDVQMPVCDGLEATRRIRAAERDTGGHVPIIGLTAHAMKADEERCLDAGMDAFLSKPIEAAALESALAPYVGESPSGGGSQRHGMSLGTLREMVNDDPDAMREIIQLFLEDYPVKLERLAEGIKASDSHAIEHSAHSLKGSVSLFDARTAMSIAAELERMGRDGGIENAPQAFSRLAQELERVRDDLRRTQNQ